MSGVAPVQDPDSVFLRAALEKALLTPQEAEQTLGAARLQGRPVSALLVERGLMAPHTVQAVSRTLAAQQPLGPNPFTSAAPSPPPSGPSAPFAATLPPMEAGQVPRFLGDFEVLKELGRGGMGAVYLAVQRPLGRQVALKVLSPGFASTAQAVDRFLRESRAAASIVHANVVTVFSAGDVAGRLYLAMELLRGGDAQQLLAREGGRLTERRALELTRDCARGLTAIERAGLIHRDIKPSNIFIAEDGAAKLADLGLARSQAGEDRMTQSGLIVGTPQFMSPEQADGAPDIDIRTDIYGIGASLYQLLTGRMPFEGNTALAVVSKVVNDPAPDPRLVAPDVSPATANLVLRCMAKQRDERPRTAAAFLAEVEALLATPAVRTVTPKAGDPAAWAPRSTTGAPKAKATVQPATVEDVEGEEEEEDEDEDEDEDEAPASAMPIILVMGALGLFVLVGAGLLLRPKDPDPTKLAASSETPPRPTTEAPPKPVPPKPPKSATEAPKPTPLPPAQATEALPKPSTEALPKPSPLPPEPATEPSKPVTEAPKPVTEAPKPGTEAPTPPTPPAPPPASEAAPATEAAPVPPAPAPVPERTPIAADDARWLALDDPRVGPRKPSNGASTGPNGVVTLQPRKGAAVAVVERNGGLAPRVAAWLVRSIRFAESDQGLLTFGVRSSAAQVGEPNPGEQPPGSIHVMLTLLRKGASVEVKGQAFTRHRKRASATQIGRNFAFTVDPDEPKLAVEIGFDDGRFRVVVLHGPTNVIALDENLAWGTDRDDDRTGWAYATLRTRAATSAVDLALEALPPQDFLPRETAREGPDGRPLPPGPGGGGQQGTGRTGTDGRPPVPPPAPGPGGPGPGGPGPGGPGPGGPGSGGPGPGGPGPGGRRP